ncbi:hypothetical protein Z043_111315, partial [Scleropages formosus]
FGVGKVHAFREKAFRKQYLCRVCRRSVGSLGSFCRGALPSDGPHACINTQGRAPRRPGQELTRTQVSVTRDAQPESQPRFLSVRGTAGGNRVRGKNGQGSLFSEEIPDSWELLEEISIHRDSREGVVASCSEMCVVMSADLERCGRS